MATVLVVDDNAVTQRVLAHTIRKAGHTPVAVLNGRDALERLRAGGIDLALLDVAMPEMDGLTLLGHIRSIPQHQALPVVMLSASAHDEDRIAARALGAFEFLSKPASSWELVETINRALS